jgi:hypothetical protein
MLKLTMTKPPLHIPDVKTGLMVQKVYEMLPSGENKEASIRFQYTIRVRYIHDFICAN